jgi:hypothetical protein
MSITFAPAVRESVSLLISLAGASGSGKTLSALKIARGLVGGDDSRIAFIDTEAGRGLHYAPAPGERPGQARFGFQYADMRPPFSPDAYMDAIAAADKAGFGAIVVDSTSHIWEGDGGVQDWHDRILDEEVERARKNHSGNWAFDEGKTRERLSIGAWKVPKMAHKRFVSRLLQCRAHLILCMRADEKMRMEKVKDERGRERTVIVQAKDMPPAERWQPICEKRLPYEMTVSFVLTPDRPGFPVPIKLQEQHRAAVPLDRPLSEDTGRMLAEWARGGSPSRAADGHPAAETRPAAPSSAPPQEPPGGSYPDELDEGREAAARGMGALQAWWKRMPQDTRTALKPLLDTELKPTAEKVDAEFAGEEA